MIGITCKFMLITNYNLKKFGELFHGQKKKTYYDFINHKGWIYGKHTSSEKNSVIVKTNDMIEISSIISYNDQLW